MRHRALASFSILAQFAICGCGAKTGLDAPDTSSAFDAAVLSTPSNLGLEFWAVSTVNSLIDARNIFHYAVAIGNPGDSTAHVTIDGGLLHTPMAITVSPHGTVTQILPWVRALSQHSYRPAQGSVCISDGETTIDLVSSSTIPDSALVPGGAYHIRSDVPISAYQFNALEYSAVEPDCTRGSYTNDASLLLPVSSLDGHYWALTHRAAIRSAPSFLAVFGTASGTHVTITPSADVKAGQGVRPIAAGQPTMFTLGAGDVIELMAVTDGDGDGGADLSGTEVSADAPVGVFAGVDCTRVGGTDDSITACDHLEQQLPPDRAWSTDVVATRFRDRETPGGLAEPYRVRILARDENTSLHFDPPAVHADVALHAHEVLTVDSTSDMHVHASGPILAAEFMFGQDATRGAMVGDPSMAMVVPTAQFRSAYAFVVPTTYTSSFVNVVMAAGTHVSLDGANVTTTPETIQGTEWNVLALPMMPGSHTLHTDAPGGVGLLVYGAAPYTSYAYPGGMNLEVMR